MRSAGLRLTRLADDRSVEQMLLEDELDELFLDVDPGRKRGAAYRNRI